MEIDKIRGNQKYKNSLKLKILSNVSTRKSSDASPVDPQTKNDVLNFNKNPNNPTKNWNSVHYNYGKLIQKDKKIYGLWKKGQLSEKIKKKDFFKKLGDEKNGFFNFFRLDNYNDVLKNVNAEEDDE